MWIEPLEFRLINCDQIIDIEINVNDPAVVIIRMRAHHVAVTCLSLEDAQTVVDLIRLKLTEGIYNMISFEQFEQYVEAT